MSWREALRDVLRSQVGVYGAVLAAGIVYVVLRTHALGFSVAYNAAQPFFSILHFQKICFTLFSYARLAVWPMTGLSPLHVVDNAYFATFSWELMADDVAVVVVMVIGAAMFARGRPLGALILSFAAGLLAVSNVIPVPFVESVYHERYLTLPLAVGTAWCSVVLVGCSQRWRLSRVVCCLALSFWLVIGGRQRTRDDTIVVRRIFSLDVGGQNLSPIPHRARPPVVDLPFARRLCPCAQSRQTTCRRANLLSDLHGKHRLLGAARRR